MYCFLKSGTVSIFHERGLVLVSRNASHSQPILRPFARTIFVLLFLVLVSTSMVFSYQTNPSDPPFQNKNVYGIDSSSSLTTSKQLVSSEGEFSHGSGLSPKESLLVLGAGRNYDFSMGSSLSPREALVVMGPGRSWDPVTKIWSKREGLSGLVRARFLNSWIVQRERSNASVVSLDDKFYSEDPTRTCSGNCFTLLKYKK